MKIEIEAIKISQPIGEFYFGKIKASLLCEIAEADVRRLENEERGVESYLGIQRPLKKERVKEISSYLNTIDATFPNSIIIAINDDLENGNLGEDDHDETPEVEILWENNKLVIEFDSQKTSKVAKILDGQHRLAGFNSSNFKFEDYEGRKEDFELLVTIFVNTDMASQAKVFSMVNQNQTKVNKSLVYDLESISTSRSPWKSCHLMAVYLNSKDSSPFYRRIKRLGVKTHKGELEPLTQAAFVENLVKLISPKPQEDRNLILGRSKGFLSFSNKTPKFLDRESLSKHPFRKMFFDDRDELILKVVMSYFSAVEETWPKAWDKGNKISVLNKTVGLIALMRLLGVTVGKFINEYTEEVIVSNLNVTAFKSFFTTLDFAEDYFTDFEATSKTGVKIFHEMNEKAKNISDKDLKIIFKFNSD